MSSAPHNDIDPVTGVSTTGHEWDGIRELNMPLPRWWLWVFYATIVWSIGYWVVYPAWPLLTSHTTGILGWNTRSAIVDDMRALHAERGVNAAKIADLSPAAILSDPQLLSFARAQGKAAFGDNCAPCHGNGGAGSRGYPNLNDDEWLWGGRLADIEATIRHGIRTSDPDSRQGTMPAFGRDGILKRPEITAVSEYVRKLAGAEVPANADLAAGQKVFAENCAVCHGEQGKGNRELGAPDLTDAIWLYGADADAIAAGVRNGRGGVMPGWSGRLDDSTIKALTVYVHTLGGGER